MNWISNFNIQKTAKFTELEFHYSKLQLEVITMHFSGNLMSFFINILQLKWSWPKEKICIFGISTNQITEIRNFFTPAKQFFLLGFVIHETFLFKNLSLWFQFYWLFAHIVNSWSHLSLSNQKYNLHPNIGNNNSNNS